jgi:beta-N-acetylhexosaminidase
VPATFSRSICTSLLRQEIGFEGVLFSDDLEMGAVAHHRDVGEAAVEAVWAGSDVVLVCESEELQARAQAALTERARSDERFLGRCRQALERSLRLRRLCPPRIDRDAARVIANSGGADLVAEIEARAAEAPPSGPRRKEAGS